MTDRMADRRTRDYLVDWKPLGGIPFEICLQLDPTDPDLAIKLLVAEYTWKLWPELTAQESFDLADVHAPIEQLAHACAARARAGERVTTTLQWENWRSGGTYDVTVTVPADWTWPYQGGDRPGPLVLAEAFYEIYGADLVTPQECCDFMADTHSNGMRRLKQLLAWRRAQVRLHGTFDWADVTSAFAVAP